MVLFDTLGIECSIFFYMPENNSFVFLVLSLCFVSIDMLQTDVKLGFFSWNKSHFCMNRIVSYLCRLLVDRGTPT